MSGIFKPPFGTPISLSHPLGPAGGLVLSMLLNEGSGNKAYDSSGQENHGTLINMADPPTPTSGWGPGPHGGALAFNGSNNYVNCGHAPGLNIINEITVIAIINPINNVGQQGIISNSLDWSYNYYLYLRDEVNAQIAFGVNKTDFFRVSNIPSLQTSYICGTYSFITKKANLYKNGQNIATGTWTSKIVTTFNDLYVGKATNVASPTLFNGLISSISIYNRALSAEEIAYLYAFPYCMFEEPDYPAWMAPNNIPAMMNYYRQMRAA